MSATMVLHNDPHAAVGQAVMFGVVAVLVAILAVWIFLPMLGTRRRGGTWSCAAHDPLV
jgi:hypothetical protein